MCLVSTFVLVALWAVACWAVSKDPAFSSSAPPPPDDDFDDEPDDDFDDEDEDDHDAEIEAWREEIHTLTTGGHFRKALDCFNGLPTEVQAELVDGSTIFDVSNALIELGQPDKALGLVN